MTTASAIRSHIEAALAARIPAPFAQKKNNRPELFPTGISSIDLLLDGGIPRGYLTEIAGNSSTGRTGLAFAAIATATRKGAACAWVDVQDAFDPESAAAWGIDLQRLLWLRAGAEALADIQARPCVVTKAQPEVPQNTSCGGMHPRNEARNMDRAVSLLFHGQNKSTPGTPRESGLLRDKSIGTPGAANRNLNQPSMEPRCAESQPHRRKVEQIATDRLPPRRGDVILNKPVRATNLPAKKQPTQVRKSSEKPWSRLDQALRATDLLLQAGGFGVIVLDMCDARAEQIQRIPIATWYRFRLAAEQAQAALVLLTEVQCAKSCAAFSLRCEQVNRDMAAPASWAKAEEKALFTSLEYRVHVDHQRLDAATNRWNKKPARNAQAIWSSCAVSVR